MAALAEIAERAGVSSAVVSRIINRDESLRVSEETRARVEAAIAEAHNAPNVAAQSLRSSRSGTTAFVLHDLADPDPPLALEVPARRRPASEWKQVRLNNVGRIRRTPQVLDRRVRIIGYRAELRQLAVRSPGHERQTLLLTNWMKTSASQLVDRCARRMVIENAIADAIGFFHMDALSASVPMKIELGLQLTLMASGLCRLLAARLSNGRQNARSCTLFRGFVKAPADITVSGDGIDVRLGWRADNPFLFDASYDRTDIAVPWLGNRRLRISFL